jgi:hypothetical protein
MRGVIEFLGLYAENGKLEQRFVSPFVDLFPNSRVLKYVAQYVDMSSKGHGLCVCRSFISSLWRQQ